jgi:hypothetical protein
MLDEPLPLPQWPLEEDELWATIPPGTYTQEDLVRFFRSVDERPE